MNNNYQAETVKTLDFFEHIRQYPGMYIGSKDINGLHHCIKEIISNSIDEYLNGAGNLIIIKIQKDGGIFIQDNARGVPHGEHSSGISVLRACFGMQNTGGKYINATGQGGYNTSGGEHGIGAKAVNALSTKLIVSSARDGLVDIVEFSKGQFIKEEQYHSNQTGLSVLFYPDPDIFETVQVDTDKLEETIREFSYLCSGLKFQYIVEQKHINKEFYSQNGLLDYIYYLSQNTKLITKPIYLQGQEGTFQVEAIIGYTSNYTNIFKIYTNNIPQDKGTHLTGFKTAWTSCLNQWGKDNNILKNSEKNLTGSDFEEGQILILNFKMIDPVFKGQNKEELSSSEGRTYVQKLITQAAKDYFNIHGADIKIILNKAINARKAREAAKKARETIRDNQKKKEKKVLKFDSKLADCYAKDRSKCELIVVEGDSASGNLKSARNNEYQAVLPIRGKLLNCLKAPLDKIQKNAEIMTLIDALGLSLDLKNMNVTYDPHELRYGKIIILADSDSDGNHIRNLFYTLIWSLCPQLILDGHVYAGIAPLYKITTSKGYKYLKDDAALTKYETEHKTQKFTVTRYKGLGELSVDETEETLLDPENRVLKQITVKDIQKTNQLFEDLMGTAIAPRRNFIIEHSKEASYNV